MSAGKILTVAIRAKEELVYITRRNLLALLSKLDRNKLQSGASQCTLIKQDTVHPKYPCSVVVRIVALEDAEYYTDRQPGEVWPEDTTTSDINFCRSLFEKVVTEQEGTRAAWPLLTRATDVVNGAAVQLDGYLDLYVQKKWEMWKACIALLGEPATCVHGYLPVPPGIVPGCPVCQPDAK